MIAVPIAAEQLTPEWHAARRLGIGSSDAPVVTGDAPWGDLLTLYAAKVGIIDPPDINTPATAWGRRLEAVVADWYSETTGRKLRRVKRLLRHPEHEWMLASLDRVVVGEQRIVEVKTSRYASDEWGAPGTAEIPTHYLIQVQHQLAVTGYPVADVAVLFAGSDPRTYTIDRDDDLIAGLIDLEAAFMECIRNGTPPDALMQSRRVRAVYRTEEVDADDVLAMGIEGVYNLRQEIKALEAEKAKAEEAVKTLIGEHTAVRAGEYRATYKPNKDSVKVDHALIAAAYRKRLAEVDPAWDAGDAAAIESLFTRVEPGFRPLRITKKDTPDE